MVSDSQSFDSGGTTPYYTYHTNLEGNWVMGDPASPITQTKINKIGTIQITNELLQKLLGIDQCHKILNVWSTIGENDIVSILVESNNLEEIPQGAMAPKVSIAKVNGYDE